MISRFFIDRPIFASVLSIVITLAGGLSVFTLPLALYPPVSPPNVSVDCQYPGASAQVVAESVATPIEQQVNGVENMMYMSSQCTNDGSYNLTVTFNHGVDLNMAQVMVQNRVSLALPLLPDVIKQTGLTTRKKSPDILMAIAINSPDGRYDQLYLSNYALMHVREEIARLPGVGDISMLGQRDYSMRVWVDPEKLSSRNMTAGDVARAIREQNMPIATGQIGQPPVPAGQPIQMTISTKGRLIDTEEFGNIIVKCTPDGRITRIRDIGRVELGAKNQDISCKVNGLSSATIAVFQLPDANALDTAVIVKDKLKELSQDFPPGVSYEIRYDTTPFIRESILEVVNTLRDAVILVAIVVLLFLQNWRSALIPLIAVPVSIIGTFAVMAAIGFSLNNLTLFGLVLAIGIVVDDAIVVVESVEHHIEHGMAPRDATIKAMEEVSGPLIAIGLVLSAVFIPCAFISGIVGQFFRQFALTIASSTVISAINSLTLSPALAAVLLRPRDDASAHEALPRWAFPIFGGWLGYVFLLSRIEHALEPSSLARYLTGPEAPWWTAAVLAVGAGAIAGRLLSRPLNWLLKGSFHLFNLGFNRATNIYTRIVGITLRLSGLMLLLYGGLLFLTYQGFMTTPKGFIPVQDMGYLLINVQLPDSASTERSQAIMNRLEASAHQVPGVKHTQGMTGQSLLLSANGSNFGSMFIILDDFDKRIVPISDRAYRLLDLNNLERLWYETVLRRPKRAPKGLAQVPGALQPYDLETRVRKWLNQPKTVSLYSEDIIATLRRKFNDEVPEADTKIFGPPPVRGVGRAGGFKIMVEDRGDLGIQELQKQTDNLVTKGNQVRLRPDGSLQIPGDEDGEEGKAGAGGKPAGAPAMVGLFTPYRANVPQIYADINRAECMSKEVALQDLFETLRIYLGSLYVNDFNRFGRTWQVIVQADASFRNHETDVTKLKVRNLAGNMIPVVALAEFREVNGPLVLTRYNMYPAAPLNGNAAPGISSGQAIDVMGELATHELPPAMAYEWTELAFLELQAGNTAMVIFGVAVLMVFLVLAAQYESWSLPLAIILVVPMCLLSAIAGVRIAKEDVNIFTQIGFVVLVGLASKNAILIVEFAKFNRDQGESRYRATLEACRLRLRPIVMTSLAFILGVVPLIVGHGAGAEMRRTLGTTVFSGMLGVTIFGIFLTPVFFFVIDMLSEARLWKRPAFRWINTVVLGTLSLRPLRILVRNLQQRAAKPASTPESGNGSVPDHEHEPETVHASSSSRPEAVPVSPGETAKPK